jgi:pimeloyl-ACP methyl ester carboxylesterase
VVEEGFQIAESGEIVSDGVVNIPTHIKLPKSGDKILVADPVTGKVPDKVNIFIGGAADEYINGNVLNSYALHRDIAGENYYFTHNSALEINNLVVGLSQDQKANLIGHSLGGATAAQVALANPGKINVLVTVDPVGPINVGRDPVTNVHILEFPDYERVSESVDTWININAGETPESTFFDDFINGNNVAEVGGKWGGDPEGDADIYLNPELDHGDFDGMLRYVDQNTGKSAEEILNE